MDIFERYAPFIQDYIYQNSWQSLRSVQTAAGDAIFNTEDNVLICASTASGKTEAAFFPILTLLDENPSSSVGVMYIGPLKALINDQFLRLNDLCAEAQIPVWHWHGDVSQTEKRRLMKKPSGILQITPESLEAMMLHRHAALVKLFGDLRFIVIDELHSLMRGDRGGQTLCLIERLCRIAGCHPRRIGLSATIGDPVMAGRFLSAGSGRGCVIPKVTEKGQTWRLSMEHFFTSGSQAGDPDYKGFVNEAVQEQASSALAEKTDSAPEAADPAMAYIFEHTRGRKCLVFCNSREEAEAVTTTLRQYCELKKEPDRFLIHHGNLSASLRQGAEEEMRDEASALTTVTTATLELGIDIGKLERAFQINAPFTVSSFLQRMGRTGRRSLPPEMWFVMQEDPHMPRDLMPDCIPWYLIQGIALIQLYREEKWVEPPRLDRLPFSLLYHQTMSTLASSGEMSPAQLASSVLSLSVFHRITQEDYKVLLRHLLEIDHIQRTEQGGLIVGVAGERITNNFRFYAVFQENEEYTVRSESQEIGTLVAPPPAGEKIAIAGHTWLVDEVDRKRHVVYCTMVKGKVPAYFGEVAGDINTKILERMKNLLAESENTTYPYLMKNAAARLTQARHMAQEAGLTQKPLVYLGGNMWALFPWLGTYAFLAMERFLKLKCGEQLGLKSLDPRRPYYMIFSMDAGEQDFYRIAVQEAEKNIDPMDLLYPKEIPTFDKYDEFLPDELLRKGFAMGVLDVKGMQERVLSWKEYLQQKLGSAKEDTPLDPHWS